MTVEQSEKSGLAALFRACHGENRAALIGYLPTGYPDVPTSIDAMKALTESGCDLIEVGVPYSDPGMDGPTIANATEIALRGGVRVRDTLAAVEAITGAGGRAVVMTYWNPVLRYGVDAFARDLAADSLDLVELIAAVEDKYDVELPEAELEKMKVIGDLWKFLEDKAAERLEA